MFLSACNGGGTTTEATGSDTDTTDGAGTNGAGSTTSPSTGGETSTSGATDEPTTTGTVESTTEPTTADTTTEPTTTGMTTGGTAACGDGFLDNGEECDDGNTIDEDECSNSCFFSFCGDGILNLDEECDDANVDNTDACLDQCKLAQCGDGFVGPGEACDDANQVDDDECNNACAAATCSDAQKNAAETDVDCGGGACSACVDGKVCKVADDCASGTCTDGKCAMQTLMLPDCMAADVTAATVYSMVVQPACKCHEDGPPGSLTMNSAAALVSNTVDIDATQADMKRVTPSNVDQSYLLYKVFDQHTSVPNGGGMKMPPGQNLTAAQQCLLVNWVKSGAK